MAGPDLIRALACEAAAVIVHVVARRGGALGITHGDLVSAGWLGYVESRAGTHAGRLVRARYAMRDEVRRWLDEPPADRQGRIGWRQSPSLARHAAPTAAHATRTKLPRRVKRALRALPVRERRALYLWTVRGWDHALVAGALGVSVSRAGSVRCEALQHLRSTLAA